MIHYTRILRGSSLPFFCVFAQGGWFLRDRSGEAEMSSDLGGRTYRDA